VREWRAVGGLNAELEMESENGKASSRLEDRQQQRSRKSKFKVLEEERVMWWSRVVVWRRKFVTVLPFRSCAVAPQSNFLSCQAFSTQYTQYTVIHNTSVQL
jgi:hypothetical protein